MNKSDFSWARQHSAGTPINLRMHKPAHLTNPAVIGRRDAKAAFESAGEMERAMVATVPGNVFDRPLRVGEHARRLLQPGLDQPGFRTHADVRFEHASEIIHIEPAAGGPVCNADVLAEARSDPFLRSMHVVHGLRVAPGRSGSGAKDSCR